MGMTLGYRRLTRAICWTDFAVNPTEFLAVALLRGHDQKAAGGRQFPLAAVRVPVASAEFSSCERVHHACRAVVLRIGAAGRQAKSSVAGVAQFVLSVWMIADAVGRDRSERLTLPDGIARSESSGR